MTITNGMKQDPMIRKNSTKDRQCHHCKDTKVSPMPPLKVYKQIDYLI